MALGLFTMVAADSSNSTKQQQLQSSSKMGGGGGSLATTYPVNTLMELKVSHDAGSSGKTIRGLIYCTDEISNVVVLKKSLVHTTLSSEITVINASTVLEKKTITSGNGNNDEEALRELAGVGNLDELKLPLPNVNRKALEERERRAIKLAEESFSHINQKVSMLFANDVNHNTAAIFVYSLLCSGREMLCSVIVSHQCILPTTTNSQTQTHSRQPPRDKKYLTNY